jgi:CRP/FNR family transcriptional regulator, anaerobic regulatory protein
LIPEREPEPIRRAGGAHAWDRCRYCALRGRGLCQGVDDRDVEGSAALEAAHGAARVYDPGDVIYAQGDKSSHVFNLISGWVAVHRDMPDGRRQITRFLLPGALFGIEPAGELLSHAASAVTNVVICPIPTSRFDELRQRIPSLNERFIQILEREYRHAIEALSTLGQGSARERIGSLLRELAVAATGNDPLEPGSVVPMPLTQRLIAEATGLTAIHVNRVLRQLREDLVVELHNGSLAIADPWKLSAIAERGAERARG